MLAVSRPDTTNEGWNTWPTEQVSHALVQDQSRHGSLRAHAIATLAREEADVAAVRLVPLIRALVEDALTSGEAEQLRESLLAFALSRVDWLQLAQAEVEASIPEDEPLPVARIAAQRSRLPL
jgi:hypothetical protein